MSPLRLGGGWNQWAHSPAGTRVTNLPARLPVVFFWTALTVSVAVLLGWFTPWLVLPALAVVLWATWRFGPPAVAPSGDALRGTVYAVGLVAVWVVVNLRFAAQVLLVQRDSGFLTLEGFWLSGNADPDIPLRSAAEVAQLLPWTSAVSDAFGQDGLVMHAQGAKTFPALLALGGWAGGLTGVRVTNLLIGAIALLAVYDLGRRLTSPRWALVPMATLMVSMPMLYFSRAAFTEPSNIVLTMGGIAVLWSAAGGQRTWPYVLGGAMIGANALSRIDGAGVVVGLIAALGLIAAGTRDPRARRARLIGFLTASATAAAMVLLGYLDLRLNSPDYLAEHARLYRPLVAMLVAALVVGLGLVALTRSPRVTGWIARHGAGLGWGVAGVVVGVAVLLASRPLWMQRHLVVPGSGQAWFVGAMQRDLGLVEDPTRSYDEMTLTWLSWYFGWLTLVLAVLGVALLARRAVTHRRPELVVLLVTLAVPSLLYLVAPSITPDQIWAMRRFLPAAIPGLLLCAGWLLHWVMGWARPLWLRVAVGVLTAVMILFPLTTWGSLVTAVEYQGRVDQVADLCTTVQSGNVVVVRGSDPPLIPTLRILCDVDAVEVGADVTTEQLAELKATWGDQELYVVSLSESIPGWPADTPPTWQTPMMRWPTTLYPQQKPVEYTSALWVGTVAQDGSVVPVSP